MGLSERKVKQRIGHDPRNLSWAGDTSRFSYKHMTSLGWDTSKGLGSGGDGNPNHIAVVRKSDNGGIGMARAKKDGDDNAAGAGQAGRGLEDVLKRLAAASASASPSPAPESPAEGSDREEKKRNKIASRQRHLQSKRLASSSPAALAEILGVPISSLPASPSPGPATPIEATPEPSSSTEPTLDPKTERTAEETVTTSTLSVTDYFKQKMREKMLARQAAAAANGTTAVEMPEGSLARVDEGPSKPSKAVGADWEGSKVKFEEEKVDLGDLGTEASTSTVIETVPVELDDKAAKKARKEAKRAKRDIKVKIEDTGSGEEQTVSRLEDDIPSGLNEVVVKQEVEDDETSNKIKKEKKDKKEKKVKRERVEDEVQVKVEPGSDDREVKRSKKDKKEKKVQREKE